MPELGLGSADGFMAMVIWLWRWTRQRWLYGYGYGDGYGYGNVKLEPLNPSVRCAEFCEVLMLSAKRPREEKQMVTGQ